MLVINSNNCKSCRVCFEVCPKAAVSEEPFSIDRQLCVECGLCVKHCPVSAIETRDGEEAPFLECRNCPVRCRIKVGELGACLRYLNEGKAALRRTVDLSLETEEPRVDHDALAISKPIISAIGAGTLYPNPKPAPLIVQKEVGGLDVVTAVTEAPLTFSGVKVKIDTDYFIGDETAKVRFKGRVVGHVTTEEYGSKILSIGGANVLTGKNGAFAAQAITLLANKERVALKIGDKSLEVQAGHPPVIDGIEAKMMRPACGSQVGSVGYDFKGLVDELIILDGAITGLMTEHTGSEDLELPKTGIVPIGKYSTPGRYLGEKGNGWGGTSVHNPADAIATIDPDTAWAGMTILVTEPNMERLALLRLTEEKKLEEIPVPQAILDVVTRLKERAQASRVTVLYVGGAGGGVRLSLTPTRPQKVWEGVNGGDISLTVGGAQTYVWPGGGLTYMVDVEEIPGKPFCWNPTPCTTSPIELTMRREVYDALEGYQSAVVPYDELKKNTNE